MSSTEALQNPPWVNKLIAKHWDALERLVGYDLMPMCRDVGSPRARTRHVECREYGCGHYGCVMGTGEQDVVCKVTSDASEAAFVVAYMAIGEQHPGIVRYDRIVELPDQHLGRRTFVIWRQEAQNVGLIFDLHVHAGIPRFEDAAMHYVDHYGRGWLNEFATYVQKFRDVASVVRESVKRSKDPAALISEAASLKDWANRQDWPRMTYESRVPKMPSWLKGARRVAMAVAMSETLAEEMANTHASTLIGSAFSFYLEHGILLADVHLNNIGEVTPEDHTTWELVITDPGHMVPLDTRWLNVKVPQLYG